MGSSVVLFEAGVVGHEPEPTHLSLAPVCTYLTLHFSARTRLSTAFRSARLSCHS